MSKLLKTNLLILSVAAIILVGSFSDSLVSKVRAYITSTNLIGYAWSDKIGWISFSSENRSIPCVVDSPLTRTISCPSGQTGTITQERTSTCPGPVTSLWATTSNTCITPCTPLSPLTQTLTCPVGQTGSITQTRTSTCPGPVTSGWTTTSSTCVCVNVPSSCNAATPACGQRTTGVTNCGISCFKDGAACLQCTKNSVKYNSGYLCYQLTSNYSNVAFSYFHNMKNTCYNGGWSVAEALPNCAISKSGVKSYCFTPSCPF